MAVRLRPGKQVHGKYPYVIERLVHIGSKADGYIAKNLHNGTQVFLKHYRSPSPKVSWFLDFVDYQKQMQHLFSKSDFSSRTLRFYDVFICERYCALVYEYAPKFAPLSDILNTKPSWNQRLTWSKILVRLILDMHEAGLVHCDLKPHNIAFIPKRIYDQNIQVMKIFDFDFSYHTVEKPPWDGIDGYLGTPGYMSPEHFSKRYQARPTIESDAFTLGIMLYEILCSESPYRYSLSYEKDVLHHHAGHPVFLGEVGSVQKELQEALFQLLNPNPVLRPSLYSIDALLAQAVIYVIPNTAIPSYKPKPVQVQKPLAPQNMVKTQGNLVLHIQNREVVLRTSFDYFHQGWALAYFGDDSRYWDKDKQFGIEKREDGWYVVPNPEAPNDTLLNERRVSVPSVLQPNDILAVGREKEPKSTVKTPLSISFRGDA